MFAGKTGSLDARAIPHEIPISQESAIKFSVKKDYSAKSLNNTFSVNNANTVQDRLDLHPQINSYKDSQKLQREIESSVRQMLELELKSWRTRIEKLEKQMEALRSQKLEVN